VMAAGDDDYTFGYSNFDNILEYFSRITT